MAGDGRAFKAFNIVGFTKRNGADDADYWRGWGGNPVVPGAEGTVTGGAQSIGSQQRRWLCLIWRKEKAPPARPVALVGCGTGPKRPNGPDG
jgi:hypothetical protein